jgi:hypothetical protein
MTEIKSSLCSLEELFSGADFEIPDFQRGYAWGHKQWDDFWKDLELLNENSRHYAGQLILEPLLQDKTTKITTFNIVDGQQRITTTFLALKAASDVLNFLNTSQSKNLAVEIASSFHFSETNGERRYKFRYANGSSSNTYLAGAIFSDPRYLAQVAGLRTLYTENMRLAYEFFLQKFKKLSELRVFEIVGRITRSLQFNVFRVSSKFDIHVAFETINNRGKQLSKLELLKNRLIYLSTVMIGNQNSDTPLAMGLRREINEAWSTIYKWLGNNPKRPLDDDDFLSTHWVAYFGYDKSEADAMSVALFEEYFTVRRVREAELSVADIQRFIRSLAQAAAIWHYLHMPTEYLPPATTIWIERIERLRWSSFKPFLLASFLRLGADEPRVVSSPTDVPDHFKGIVPLLQQVERFIFMVFYMAERRAHTGRTQIYDMAARLCPGGAKYDESMTANTHLAWAERYIGAMNDNGTGEILRHARSDDAEFLQWEGYFNLADFRDNAQRRLGRSNGYYGWDFSKVVLFEYEQSLQGKNKAPKVAWEHVSSGSIEHIYPQTPTDPYWEKRFPFDRRQERKKNMWQNSLGNLLLLSKSVNSSVGNTAFPKKVAAYQHGSFSENEVAADYKHWTPKHIIGRGEKMLEFIQNRWNIRFDEYQMKPKDCLVVPELVRK